MSGQEADFGVTDASAPVQAENLPPLESFEQFYRREFPALAALARAVTGSSAADDLAQEVMIVVLRRWTRVSRLDEPRVWARRVCLNLSRSLVRRRVVEARALRTLGGRRDEPPPLDSSSEQFWLAVRSLPRRQAQAAALRYVLDLDVAEIAASMGCSPGSAKTHLARARVGLQRQLLTDDPEVTP